MPNRHTNTRTPAVAVVMSGGGARGAYEAGVLAYLLDELPERLGRPVRFDIVTGTSVGAIHACYLAATQTEAGAGTRLADVWRSFTLDAVFPVRPTEASFVNPTYLAGKALNALLLDRIETDVDRMRLFNAVLETGAATYGPDFLARINEPIVALRNRPYRIVRDVFLRPSEDLGVLASEALRTGVRSHGLRSWLSQNVARYAARGALGEADLLSYLFFDRAYTEPLLELGRADAQRSEKELVNLFAADE